MRKYSGTRYNSQWDGSTTVLVGLIAAVCLWPILIDDWILAVTICVPVLTIVIGGLLGTYYKVTDDQLVVYSAFIPTVYPINKIKSIKPTKSILSAPAISLIHRIAITFTDRKVLKSFMPLIISPVRQDEFIAQLLSINPDIQL